MLRSAHSFGLLVVFAVTVSAQRTPPTPTAPTIPVHAPGSQTPPQTLKASAQLVVVDVIATDSKQIPIHGLKASDFTVTDNGVPQQVTSFEEHIAPSPAQLAKLPPMHPLPAGIFTNYTPVPTDGPINVLLLDALNTAMKDQSYVRSQLREFLRNTPVGTRMAIFVLNDRLIMLQGVTSDLTLLKSVVERTGPDGSILLGDSTGDNDNVGNGGTKTASATLADIGGADVAVLGAQIQQAEAVMAAMNTQNRALQTLNAMNELAHYLGGISGRKNLIWFSGSFPLTIFPDSTIEHPFAVVAGMDEEYRETTNLLARSQVAVYPIDARGLKVLTPSVTKDSGGANVGQGLATATNKMFQDNANENATMEQMASDTGGRAFINVNALSEAVTKALDNGSSYYTLSYTPSEFKPDGKFHKIQVKLDRSGVTLAHRAGYFTYDANESGHSSDLARVSPGQPSPFIKTMMHGAPDATEILLKLQVLPVSDATEDAVVSGNIFNKPQADKVNIKGPFRRYAIDIAADARDVQITPTPEGRYQFTAEIVTCVYDSFGVLINSALERARGNLSAATYANMRHTGLQFHQEISVPVSGQFYLRTSVRDLATDHYGSVEVPVTSVAKLPPLAASAAPNPASQ